MYSQISLGVLATIVATASSAILPLPDASVRAAVHAVPEAPAQPPSNAFHIIPPWLMQLIESYVYVVI